MCNCLIFLENLNTVALGVAIWYNTTAYPFRNRFLKLVLHFYMFRYQFTLRFLGNLGKTGLKIFNCLSSDGLCEWHGSYS